MIELAQKYRRWLLGGVVVAFAIGLAMGLAVGLLQTHFLINWCFILAVGAISIRLLVMLWHVPTWPALYLLLIGLTAYWISFSFGFLFGHGDGEAEIVVACVGLGIGLAWVFGLLLLAPHRPRDVALGEGLLSHALSFRLWHLLAATALMAVLFGVGRMERGTPRNYGWHPVNDTGRAAVVYETAPAAIDVWLNGQGYLLDNSGESRVVYRRLVTPETLVYVEIRHSPNFFSASIKAHIPHRILPYAGPQEHEGDRMAKAVRRWWAQHVNEHDGR